MERYQNCTFSGFPFKSSCRINKQNTVSQRIALIMDTYALSGEKSQPLPSLYVFFLDTEHTSYCRCSLLSLNPYWKNRHLQMALYPSPSPLFLLFTCQVIVFVTMWIGCTHTPCTVHFATTPKRPLFRRHQFGNNADNSKTNSRSPLHKTNYIHGFPYCYTQQWYANRQTNSNPINIHQR